MKRRASCIKLGIVTVTLTLMLSSVAALSATASSVRYNGMFFTTIGLDTSAVNSKLSSTVNDKLGDRAVIVGVEGVAGQYNGWIIGGFGCTGQISSAGTNSSRTELEVALGGVSVETQLNAVRNTEYIAGLRIGGGKYTLKFVDLSSEQQIDSLPAAADNFVATSVDSPVWFIEPSLGMRSWLNNLIVVEAKVGYNLSMSNGEWSYHGKFIDTANIKMGGPTISVGVKLGAF